MGGDVGGLLVSIFRGHWMRNKAHPQIGQKATKLPSGLKQREKSY